MLYVIALVCIFAHCTSAYSGLYYDNGDMTIIDQKMSKNDQRELEEDILQLLGLHRPPRPVQHASGNSAPRFLMDVYESLEAGEERDLRSFNFSWDEVSNIETSDFIMSFVNHGHRHAGLVEGIRHHKDQVLWFDLREVPVTQELIFAELKLHKKPVSSSVDRSYTVHVYVIEEEAASGVGSLSHVASVNTSQEDEGWIRINLTDVVKTWVVFPDKNKGLYITASSANEERLCCFSNYVSGMLRNSDISRGYDICYPYNSIIPSHIGIVGSKGEEDLQPFLAAFFSNPTLNQRSKRATRKKKRRDYSYYSGDILDPFSDYASHRRRKRTCQKLTLFVSFRDLRWQDWIIAPDGYAAFYCSGECTFPLNTHLNATNHAIVQTLVNLMNPFIVPKPRCAPTKLSHISVLYYDDNNNVILRKYKNMVVESCGCH